MGASLRAGMRRAAFLLLLTVLARDAAASQPDVPKGSTPPEVRKEIEDLDSRHESSRLRAIENLGGMGGKAAPAVELLCRLLRDDPASKVRYEAIGALMRIGDPKAGPALVETLKDGDLQVARRAAYALRMVRAPQAVDAILGVLAGKPALKHDAVFLLGELRNARAVPALLPLLFDNAVSYRRQAAEALEKIRSLAAGPAFVEALKDRDVTVRSVAVRALGDMRDHRAIEPLIESLLDPEWVVRARADEALEAILVSKCRPADCPGQPWWNRYQDNLKVARRFPVVISYCIEGFAIAGETYHHRIFAQTYSHRWNSISGYSLRKAPTGMTVDAVTGDISWTPGFDQTGEHTVVCAVTDRHGEVTERENTLRVLLPAPSKFDGYSTPEGIHLSWSPIRGAVKYRIDRADTVTNWTVTSTSFLDTTARPGQTYSYWVVGLDERGNPSPMHMRVTIFHSAP